MNRIVLNKKDIVIFAILFILFIPVIVTKYEVLDSLTSLLQNLIYIIVIINFVTQKKIKIDNVLKYIIIYFTVYVIITIINNGNFLRTIINCSEIIITWIIFYQLYNYRGNRFILILRNVLAIYVLVNLITVILLPNGVYSELIRENEWHVQPDILWILGGKNSMIYYLIPLNFLSQYLLIEKKGSKIINMFFIIISLITPFFVKASTSTIAIIVLSLYLLFNFIFKKIKNKQVLFKHIIILYIIFSICLITNNTNNFAGLTSLFGKDVTFTGRTYAWQEAKKLIFAKPIIGYGYLDTTIQQKIFGSISYVNCHNSILDILLNGGVVLLGIFIITIKLLFKDMKILPKNQYILITLLIASIAVVSMLEAITFYKVFWNIVFIAIIVIIDCNKKSEKKL